ncbi:hypothetical protein GCM10009867_19940 [Pedococcus aerophilus]|uniref:Protein kinase domain-containing protein n=1 Tax=Pedococcus aerophilus TaxID=436356 RepID=A0ABP6H4N6_9MICO
MMGAQPEMEIGPYRLIRELGHGGFGTVWLAQSERSPAHQAAVKILTPISWDHHDAVARFGREWTASSKVRSRNIARPQHCDLDARPPWIAYEYIDGRTLREQLADGPLTPFDAATIFLGVANGLKALAYRDIVHRDLSLDNIMVRSDPARGLDGVIIDCGIASLGEGTHYTRDAVGRMEFQAPEQLQGVTLGPAVDVWQFAVVLVKSLTGHLPFAGKDLGWRMREAIEGGPDLRGLPEPFIPLVRQSLSLSPKDRPTATQLIQSLELIKQQVTPLVQGRLERLETQLAHNGEIRLYGVVKVPRDGAKRTINLYERDLRDGALMLGDEVSIAEDLPGAPRRSILQMANAAERSGRERPIKLPTTCPSCGTPLPKSDDGGVVPRCPRPRWCPSPLRARMRWVARRLSLPLEDEDIETLLTSGLVHDESELFSLTRTTLGSIARFSASTADGRTSLTPNGERLLAAIEANMNMSMEVALSAVGFAPNFLTHVYFTIDEFLQAMREDPQELARVASNLHLPDLVMEPHADDLWRCRVLDVWLSAGVRIESRYEPTPVRARRPSTPDH